MLAEKCQGYCLIQDEVTCVTQIYRYTPKAREIPVDPAINTNTNINNVRYGSGTLLRYVLYFPRWKRGCAPCLLPLLFRPASLSLSLPSALSRQGPCLVCVDPPIEDADGKLPLRLTPADVRALRTDMPFKALPENGLVRCDLWPAAAPVDRI